VELRVRYFASLADLTGTSDELLEIAEPADVAALWAAVGARHPAIGRMDYRPMVACDMQYATWDTPLDGVREVAFLPPVSGG
jgi:molybdopterin converting factor subunit 1